MEEPAGHGSFRDGQDARDFSIAESLQLLQHDDLPVVLSELGQSLPEHLFGLSPLPNTLGPAFRIRRLEFETLVQGFQIEPGAPTADGVPALIAQDLKEPGAEGTPEIESGQGAPGLDEGVLDGVSSIFLVPHHPDGDPHTRQFVRADDGLEESRVPCLAHLQELPLDIGLQPPSTSRGTEVRCADASAE